MWAGVRSWNSSTSSTPQTRLAAARALGSVHNTSIAPRICSSKSTTPASAKRARNRGTTSANSRTSPPNSCSTALGERKPKRVAVSASIQTAKGSAIATRLPPTKLSSICRTSCSSITWGGLRSTGRQNGPDPRSIARARLLRVRICRPTRSVVRSCISSRARTLNATRQTVAGSIPRSRTKCRARSVRTRVFPDPAGAMILAPPPLWATARS